MDNYDDIDPLNADGGAGDDEAQSPQNAHNPHDPHGSGVVGPRRGGGEGRRQPEARVRACEAGRGAGGQRAVPALRLARARYPPPRISIRLRPPRRYRVV